MVIDSTRAYRPLWFCFRVLAPTFFGARSRSVYVYMVMLHFLITVMFPLHLLLGLLLPSTPAEFFQNLTMSVMCVSCSLKNIVQLSNLSQLKEIEELLKQLDDCVQSAEEKCYFHETLQRRTTRITRCFYISYGFIYLLFLAGALLIPWTEPRELIYLAWFPFNWRNSGFYYGLAFSFQFFAIFIECLQGLTNDVCTPLTLCYLGGHLHMFGIRMSRLGFDQLPGNMTQKQLHAYFEDYKLLMRLHQKTRETISKVQLVQILFCGANLCIIVYYIIFYVRDTVSLVYNIVLFVIVGIQLYPCCYFASVVAAEAAGLPHAIFSGNWYEQSVQHRRNVLIFIQLTLRLVKRPLIAGGLIELNLKTFMETVKMAYSLYAVVVQTKNN